jgi:phospholipase C
MRIAAPAAALAALAALVASALAVGAPAAAAQGQQRTTATPIKHFVFLMQAGHTFDNYFGTYPKADGLPAHACQPVVVGQPRHGCVRPFAVRGALLPALVASPAMIARQYDKGRMDGFVAAYHQQHLDGRSAMGYYDQAELPFYWTVARDYVLFDHFFSSSLLGTRANMSYWVAAAPPPVGTGQALQVGYARQPTIFDRLQGAGVSWKFYVQGYGSRRSQVPTSTGSQAARATLLNYARFARNRALSMHIVGLDQYYRDAAAGTLPAVAFIVSSASDNERSARTILAGQNLVRNLVTQLMLSRDWDSSAFMWTYDGSGGQYDHLTPPRAGSGMLGLRVPALLVSAFARRGQVNHAVLSDASALRFIEQNWHLAPLTRLDASAASLNSAFDFSAAPRPADIIAPVRSSPATAQLHRKTVPVALVYVLYGTAAGIALVFLAGLPAFADLRRRRAGRRGADRRTEDSGVPQA